MARLGLVLELELETTSLGHHHDGRFPDALARWHPDLGSHDAVFPPLGVREPAAVGAKSRPTYLARSQALGLPSFF
jgi:hypothetical protein